MNSNVLRFKSPDPSIALVGLTTTDKEMLLQAELSDLPSVCFWLDNHSDHSILGIATIWTLAQQDGRIRKMQFTADSFLDRLARPIVAPHSRLLIAPRMWVPEYMLPGYLQNDYFTRFQRPSMKKIFSELGKAKTVSVSIDTGIFSDGRIVGPNLTGFDADLLGRKSAVQTIASIVQAAGSPQAAKNKLQQLVSQPVPRADRSVVWQYRFAQRLLHSPDFARTLDDIEHSPSPPAFYGNLSKSVPPPES